MTALLDPRAVRFDVDGYLLDRLFRVRRLGHIGLNCTLIDECLRRLPGRARLPCIGPDRLHRAQPAPGDPGRARRPGRLLHAPRHRSPQLRHLQQARPRGHIDTKRSFRPAVTVNQISWQVGSLREVVDGESWLRGLGEDIQRAGRDMPGSNWHTYFYDPEGHTNELFYGMEQVGLAWLQQAAGPVRARPAGDREASADLGNRGDLPRARRRPRPGLGGEGPAQGSGALRRRRGAPAPAVQDRPHRPAAAVRR